MGIKIDKSRKSTAYIGSFSFESADDMIQLDDLRTMGKRMNQDLKRSNMNYQFYVKCQGRSTVVKRGAFGTKYHFSLPLTKSEYVDAYIYQKNLTQGIIMLITNTNENTGNTTNNTILEEKISNLYKCGIEVYKICEITGAPVDFVERVTNRLQTLSE